MRTYERANNSWRSPDDWQPFADLGGLIRMVLLVDWDPIGLLGHAGAMDQYDRYVDDLWDLLRHGSTRDALVAHLIRMAYEQMGMRGPHIEQNSSATADKLLLVYRTVCLDERIHADP